MTTSVVLNLAARYAAAFGTVAIGNYLNKVVVNKNDTDYDVAVYDDLNTFFEETAFEFAGQELQFSAVLHDTNGSTFAPPLMLSFSKKKKLIETTASGSGNVIVERWGTSPWNIDIKGILVDVANRQYPNEKIKSLCRLFDHNNIIKVTGEQFLDKSIGHIYLKGVSITPVEGFADTVQISLTASSISELGYNLIDPENA